MCEIYTRHCMACTRERDYTAVTMTFAGNSDVNRLQEPVDYVGDEEISS